MPIAPAPVIDGQVTWTPFDTSGVQFDPSKLIDMPVSLYETEGFRMQLEEHGLETTRIFRCAWSDVADAMQWFYGYSYLADQRFINGGAPSPNGEPPTSSGPAGEHVLSRIPPAQDWYLPYLYADRVELVECLGVPLQDPGLFLKDINGAGIDLNGVAGGSVLLRPAVGFFGLGVGRADIGPVLHAGPPPDNPLPGGVGGFELAPPDPAANDVILEAAEPAGVQMLPGLVFAEQPGTGVFSDGAATLRVTYRQRPYVVRNDAQNNANGQGELGRWVERQPKYAIQGLPLYNLATSTTAGNQLKFSEGFPGTVVPEAGVMLVPTGAWQYIWHDVPFYPAATIEACQGKVNAADFDGIAGFPSFPAGTLLCQAPEISWRRNACGQIAFRIVWNLDYRPADGKGWNGFPAGDGKFYTATWGGGAPADDGSNLVFKPADFSLLFAVGETFAFV